MARVMHEDPVDRWEDIDALFDRVLDLPSTDRAAFLDEACRDVPELRDALERLLRAEAEARRFLEASVDAIVEPEILSDALDSWTDSDTGAGARVISDDPAQAPVDRSGEIIGPYRLVRLLGRGGMASVYLAERADGQWHRQVALKLLRRGLDTDDLVRRFVAERQILSSLSHPNIARLLDGGATDDGLPYLVMDYVEGTPITRYCEEHESTVDDRLRLFQAVGRAVQYAHANLVVHRDLKPSNILVTADGSVKLLDFGIAKLLDPDGGSPDAQHTRTGFQPLTPEYASPEQVRGETITTASDVYQLGVLLYRMLTGRRPYEIRSIWTAALAETIERPDPPRPSSIGEPERNRRRLRGDLDVIVLKALRKEPERRYGSAIEMVEDVRRHLEGRPITARRESRPYRVRKFLRRNAWIAPTAVVVLLVLGGYIATLTQHGRQLEAERNVARDVQQAFVGFFTAPDSLDIGLGEGRRDLTVREAILEGADRIQDDLADRPVARAELLGAMAAVLYDLDEPDRALELAEEALKLDRSLHGERSAEYQAALLLVSDLTRLTDRDSARTLLTQHLALSRDLYGAEHAATARSLQSLGLLEQEAGNLEEGERLLEESVRIYRAADAVPARRMAEALGYLSAIHRATDQVDEALAASREAYTILLSEYGAQHSQTAVFGAKLAQDLAAAGQIEESRQLHEASIETLDRELGPTHSVTISSRNNYSLFLGQIGDLKSAEAVQRELLDARRQRYGEMHEEVAANLQNLASSLKGQGLYEEADSLSSAAYRIYREVLEEGHYLTAYPLLTLSEIRLIRGDYTGARIVAEQATLILREALPEGHYATAVAECRWGRSLAGLGNVAEARRHLEAAVSNLNSLERQDYAVYRDECLAALEAL